MDAIASTKAAWTATRELDPDFWRCWRLQNCGDCLAKEKGCTWCPFSWTCVPNNYSIPLLAPAWDEGICPHWAERWEVRTRPLGCQVSTITTLTALVSILSTIALFALVCLVVFLVRRIIMWGKADGFSQWKARLRRLGRKTMAPKDDENPGIGTTENAEREPLLPP